MNNWKLLRSHTDFKKVYRYVFAKYGAANYRSVLNTIENELEFFEEATEDERQKLINNADVPYSVEWYYGIIDTEYFLNECWI